VSLGPDCTFWRGCGRTSDTILSIGRMRNVSKHDDGYRSQRDSGSFSMRVTMVMIATGHKVIMRSGRRQA
jgi:hypothetical protein